MNNNNDLEKVNCLLQEILEYTQEEIVQELRKTKKYSLKRCKRHGRNRRNSKTRNDYSNYFWIEVKAGEQLFWITLFYNDIDGRSGNVHTQFGRIQFWIVDKNDFAVNSPHRKNKCNKWMFCKENASSYSVWIDDKKNYSAYNVVKAFDIFVNKMERKINKQRRKENA